MFGLTDKFSDYEWRFYDQYFNFWLLWCKANESNINELVRHKIVSRFINHFKKDFEENGKVI